MQLENSFTIARPVDAVWPVLTDLPRIAVCMPGARVTGSNDDGVDGEMGLKLGPIRLAYAGTVRVIEKDDTTHRAVLTAAANENRGGGTVQARIAARVEPTPDGAASAVTVLTELDVTGRPAQFGRGVMTDVGQRVMSQFAANLEGSMTLSAPDQQPGTHRTPQPAAPVSSAAVATRAQPSFSPPAGGNDLSLGDLVPDSVRTYLPVIAGTLAGVVVGWLLRRAPRLS